MSLYLIVDEWFKRNDGTVSMRCPGCQDLVALSGHDIDQDGCVQPPVIHGCGFHDHVKLEDWKFEEVTL